MSYYIIPPQVPFVDAQTGTISREWYQFLLNIFKSTGSGATVISGDQFQALTSIARGQNLNGLENAIRDFSSVLQQQRSERSAIEVLLQRVAALEAQIQTIRLPAIDPRIADLQTFTYGSRPWL